MFSASLLLALLLVLCQYVSPSVGQFLPNGPPLLNNNDNNEGADGPIAALPFPNEIINVELFVQENAKAHHTNPYEIVDGANPPLVIRRADVFVIGVKFRRPYDARRDKVRLEFMFGKFSLSRFVLVKW